ncbi:OmpA family protein [Marilutibacter aestuarii]|uniref:OmpA family protein n=1 Tax=Marilutibacter aestuarii TaxID=1706195 RepID=A0A508ALI7_9GAMM|nr:OmpA family protein [Lysobacter aestuarii]TQD51000.1 OmpA family protein [Lysobacter aestuarii]
MKRLAACLALALVAAPLAHAQSTDPSATLAQRLAALDSDPAVASYGAYERLQARQALEALDKASSRNREAARYVAERRVSIAEIAARNQVLQQELGRLETQRSELLIEASRRDAAQARAEAERLRLQAQLQAEEAARLREQTEAGEAAMQDVENALVGVAGVENARLKAAREREAALARQEAELMAGGALPPSKQERRGEVFTLSGDAFASGRASLTPAAEVSTRALATYLQAGGGKTRIQVEGHTDDQGDPAANQALSQRRAQAVADALVAAGVSASRVQVEGLGQSRPLVDNGTAEGRARNRRVEVIVK